MGNENVKPNTEAGDVGDIFSVNIFAESDEPKLTENLPGANLPSIDNNKKNEDEASVTVPKTTDIPVGVYNDAIDNLQKVLKESADVLQSLKTMRPVTESVDDAQDRFTESAIDNAIFESYCDGPYFEAVAKENKSEIKAIVKKIKKQICKFTRSIKWYTSSKTIAGTKLGFFDAMILAATTKEFKMFAWQTICIIFPSRGTTIRECLDSLTEEFKDELGDYEFKIIKFNAILGPIINNPKEVTEEEKDKKRKMPNGYILIIDSKDAETPKEVSATLTGEVATAFEKMTDDVNKK